MRDGWGKVALGDIVTITKGATPTQKAIPGEYPLVVTAAEFLTSNTYQFEGEAVCVPMVSSTGHGHASLKRIHCASGKFAVANIISALQKRDDAPVDMKFLHLLLDHQRDSIIVPLMKGTANVSLSQTSLAGAVVTLPPIEEQHRAVDLMADVDASILAAQDEADSASAAVGLVVEAMTMNATGGAVTALKKHGTFTRGKRFTKAQYTDHGLPCVHYGQIYTDLGPVTSKALSHLPNDMKPKLRLAQPGDVIVATTSENIEDIGKATLWSGTEPAAYHDDSYAYKHDLNPVFASYLFSMPEFHHRKRKFAAGLKVMRLSGASLESLELPIPDRAVQDKIADAASALTASAEAAAAYADNLRNLRANLLTALLSGEHEIPESYDDIMEATS